MRKLRALPFPVVAAVNGVAAGAGCNIALNCDIVLAARSAKLRADIRQGRPGAGFRRHLAVAAAGGRRTRARLALLAEPLPADKAEEWGLIWKAVDDAALMTEAQKLCEHFASAPTHGCR